MENEKMNVQETMEQQNEQSQKAAVAEGKIPTAQLPTKFMLFVRIAAGAYVAYAGFSAKAGLATMAGAEKAFLTAAVVAFPIIGLFLIIQSVRALKMGKYVDGAMDAGRTAEAGNTEGIEHPNRITFSDEDDI